MALPYVRYLVLCEYAFTAIKQRYLPGLLRLDPARSLCETQSRHVTVPRPLRALVARDDPLVGTISRLSAG